MTRVSQKGGHHWRFNRVGGFDQVRIESSADLRHLGGLDQKLWAALSCPTHGVEFDARTLALLDGDQDGRIRVPEVLEAVAWVCAILKEPSDILKGETALPLAAIDEGSEQGALVLHSAERILENLGKANAKAITAEDTADTHRIFAETHFNGDGVIPAEAAENPRTRQAIEDIIAYVGAEPDRSGLLGVTQARCEQFFTEATAYAEWWAEAAVEGILPLGEATGQAATAYEAACAKIDDYFIRTRLASYDPRALTSLNPGEANYSAISGQALSPGSPEVAALPLALIAADRGLPLRHNLNPAWSEVLGAFRSRVCVPLLGDQDELSEVQWQDIKGQFAAYTAWQGRKRGALVEPLGITRVKELLSDGSQEQILRLIAQDKALEATASAIDSVDRLASYYCHLHTLLNNFVSLRDFYTPSKKAIFQVGTLYLDGRSCELCVRVNDVAAHSTLAGLSRTYLAYCDCQRRGGDEKMTVAAAFTDGDADNLMVGRNGVFYDRQGRDWDATIVKVLEHSISVAQAFWSPYKRVARIVGEQIGKFAGARDKAVDTGATNGIADTTAHAKAAKVPPPPAAPFDIAKFAGIFAAMGLALGAIGTALASMVTGFMALSWWQMPLALAGLVLVISVPSTIMAYLKLRQRNLGPLLDANGWAVNTLAKINIPFGATLTGTATLPRGAERSLRDPFAEKHCSWGLYVLVLLLFTTLGAAWYQGHLTTLWGKLSGQVATETPPTTVPEGQETKPKAE